MPQKKKRNFNFGYIVFSVSQDCTAIEKQIKQPIYKKISHEFQQKFSQCFVD